jgi:thioredoxin-like negative regulator of GroEL
MFNIFASNFVLSSLEEAQNLSKSTKQPILAIFGSDSCSFCTKLINDIDNGQLTDYLDSYIICYIDLKTNANIKNKYKVNMIPDSRIIIDNKEVSKATGYNKNEYIKWLKNVK